ncbi:hypothetical protein [Acidocella sp. KAb 2-4]|uniref:hypothetical protein n=1 Tax=Acidocella sp. KAb 2-4 TaxID=2885158 RepID=UPI001D092F30|nr:hypothetical protein [Acidocella sp. KAb 2-4]MCB5944261.1 hypothetical protein [Acidocella sp. KAb 2-4]
MTIFGLALAFLIQMIPTPPADWSPAQVAAMYASRGPTMRLGCAIAAWTSGFMVPLAVVIYAQLSRLEKGTPVWSTLQLVGGIMMSIFLVLPPIFWGAAAFHPDRAIDATAVMNDLANLTLVTTDQYYMFQMVPIAVIALTTPPQHDSAFPRWVGWVTIWAGLIFEVGPFGFLFKTGVFAWNGLFVFWFPLTFFGAWIGVMAWSLLRAIRRQEAG